jgi:hypothetical protein
MNTDEEIIMTQTMGPGIKWSDSSQTQMLNGEYLPLDFDGHYPLNLNFANNTSIHV